MVKNADKTIKETLQQLSKHPKTILAITILSVIAGYFHLLHNSVIQICIIILVLGVLLYERTNNYLYLFLFVLVYAVNEILYVLIGFDIFPSHHRTELCYSSALITRPFNNEQFSKMHPNLTEGLYPGCKYIDPDKAEINRFNKFMELSNIESGDSVLDAGCGHGDLVEYMRSQGVNAHGITITYDQYQDNVKRFGNNYTHGDYTHLHDHLIGKFDHIILPGSLEHPFGGCVLTMETVRNKSEKMTEMFEMFKKYYKPDSNKKNLLTTCIHTHELDHPLWNLKNKAVAYCTERMFGGCYPTYGRYSVAESMRQAGYDVKVEEDYTKAYYLSSYYSIEHFGNPADLGYGPLFLSWLCPIIAHGWIYWNYGMWMWMWSGKLHKRRAENEGICNTNKTCDLFYEEDFNKRPCSLLYTVSSCK